MLRPVSDRFAMPQPVSPICRRAPLAAILVVFIALVGGRQALRGDSPTKVADPSGAATKDWKAPTPPPADALAESPETMKPYLQPIEDTDVKIEMVPIPGGTFRMGSPGGEEGRSDDEGPQHEVKVDPFWMGKFEVTWDQYDIWNEKTDVLRRDISGRKPTPLDLLVDGMTRPTEPYTDMSFGFGRGKAPAICMTQHAARIYCQWLSAKTGFYYRLPTEAEWEYACRAGTTTAYSFGDDPSQMEEHAVFIENSNDQYEEVGTKKPNPWGLYDMHGNVAEWVLDQYREDAYASREGKATENPLEIPKTVYPRVVRGGGWDHEADRLRSAARIASDLEWSQQDPQIPQSIWYHTDALSVGFRLVRPFRNPTSEEKAEKWDKNDPPQVDEE